VLYILIWSASNKNSRRNQMAIKKPATRKAVVKKPVVKKPAAKVVSKKGPKYACDVCGLVVSVDTACGCEEIDLLCCSEPMRMKK
jgi:hypothetical protein